MRVNIGKLEIQGNKFFVIVTVLVLLVGLLTSLLVMGAWEIFVNTPYYDYGEEFGIYAEGFQYGYQKNIGNFKAYVIKPHFLKNDGKLILQSTDSNVVSTKNDHPPLFRIIAYPSTLGETEYILEMSYIDEELSNSKEVVFIEDSSQITFTKNVYGVYNITQDFESEKSYELLCDNIELIREMLKSFEEIWDVDGTDDIKQGFEAKHRMV